MTKPATKQQPQSAIGDTTRDHLEDIREMKEIYGDPVEPKPQITDALNSVRARIKEGEIRVTGLAKSRRKFKAETSIERIANQKGPDGKSKLSTAQVEAAKRFYTLAVIYGEMGRVASMDFSKEVFGGNPSGNDGAWLEDQKQDYIAAMKLISKRYSAPMMQVILYDATLTEAGHMCGYKGPNAGVPMLPILSDTLDRLARHFGLIVDKTDAA